VGWGVAGDGSKINIFLVGSLLQEYAVMRSIQKHQVSYQIFVSKLKVFLLMISTYCMSVPTLASCLR
jgi:acid stress-induced BolA-like protein IbaG/YrbA